MAATRGTPRRRPRPSAAGAGPRRGRRAAASREGPARVAHGHHGHVQARIEVFEHLCRSPLATQPVQLHFEASRCVCASVARSPAYHMVGGGNVDAVLRHVEDEPRADDRLARQRAPNHYDELLCLLLRAPTGRSRRVGRRGSRAPAWEQARLLCRGQRLRSGAGPRRGPDDAGEHAGAGGFKCHKGALNHRTTGETDPEQ